MKRTTEIDLEADMALVAKQMRARAATGTFNGRPSGMPYMHACRRDHYATRTRLIFTRDTGHHTSGWLSNPDYERCLHLSTSPLASPIYMPGVVADLDKGTVSKWVRAFFGSDADKVWAESPKSDMGKTAGVWHWRLFCDAKWNAILPRDEVYTREFIEEGWRSASQMLAEDGIEIVSVLDPT